MVNVKKATKRPMYSWKEDPPRRCISRSFGSIDSSDAYPFSPSRSGQLFKGDAEIRGRNAANRGNEGIVGKTRSLLTGTEPGELKSGSKRKERSVRTVRGTAEEREKEAKKKKGAHTPPPAGLDQTHACDPMVYRVSIPI